MCSWKTHIFAYHTSFYWNNVARHLWTNLQTCKLFGGEKEYECIKCKGTFKKFFQHFWLLYAFLVRMTACTLHIKLFPWYQEPKWPQWPQQPQQPSWWLFSQFLRHWICCYLYQCIKKFDFKKIFCSIVSQQIGTLLFSGKIFGRPNDRWQVNVSKTWDLMLDPN